MSVASKILNEARAAGMELSADGSALRWKALTPPPPDLLGKLAEHKPALLELLAPARPRPATSSVAHDSVARIENWLNALDRLPADASRDGIRLAKVTKEFALGPWPHSALAAGWTDGELFSLAYGPIAAMSRITLHLISVDEDKATFMDGRGKLRDILRTKTEDPPWWDDRRIVGEE